MRLACYGWVRADSGSVASAGHTVLAELLERGHRVDLFANRAHVPAPADFVDRAEFGYVGIAPPRSSRLPPPIYLPAELALGPLWRASWRRRFGRVAGSRHAVEPYDALLTLGVAPAFVIAGVPTVAWLQGPLHTELEAIRRLRPLVCRVSGRPFYMAVTGYYRLRTHRDRHVLDECNQVVCGSTWAMGALASQGFPGERLHALPYPIDLERFRPSDREARAGEGPVVLSIGRLDPRKRLDLLVAAFDIVARTLPGARLLIVGRPGYAPKQLSLLETSAFRDRIEFRPTVAQADVPGLLADADVLVQPSENENFGSAVAEALACGVPVVVGPSNGTADYIDQGSATFTSYDARAVADTVLQVIERRRSDPGKSARTARASAEKWFSPGTVVDRVEHILNLATTGAPADR